MSQVSEDANTVDRFLKEPIIQQVLTRVAQDAYYAFRRATTEEERVASQALARAVDQVEAAFRAVVDAGERERMDEQSAERRLATR